MRPNKDHISWKDWKRQWILIWYFIHEGNVGFYRKPMRISTSFSIKRQRGHLFISLPGFAARFTGNRPPFFPKLYYTQLNDRSLRGTVPILSISILSFFSFPHRYIYNKSPLWVSKTKWKLIRNDRGETRLETNGKFENWRPIEEESMEECFSIDNTGDSLARGLFRRESAFTRSLGSPLTTPLPALRCPLSLPRYPATITADNWREGRRGAALSANKPFNPLYI